MTHTARLLVIALLAFAVLSHAATTSPARNNAAATSEQQPSLVTPPTPHDPPPVLRAAHEPVQETDAASVLAFSKDGFDWRVDWWKALIILVVVLVSLALLIHLTGKILRFVGWLFCLAFAAGISYVFTPEFVAPLLERHASFLDSTRIPVLYWGYALTFLVGLFVATLLIISIRRSYDATAPKKDAGENG